VSHVTKTAIIDTALADRTAQLSRQQTQPVSKPASPSPQSSQIPTSKERTGTPTKGSKDTDPTNPSATQKARTTLQAQLSDLTTQLSALSTQQKVSQSQVATLSKQVLELERKLQDRDDELRGKSKMVEQAQDEMVALELQFNLAEQRSEKLEMENKELVERWMKRMGEEAEKVNRDSRWE
jgi:chromosome segregation ATPase